MFYKSTRCFYIILWPTYIMYTLVSFPQTVCYFRLWCMYRCGCVQHNRQRCTCSWPQPLTEPSIRGNFMLLLSKDASGTPILTTSNDREPPLFVRLPTGWWLVVEIVATNWEIQPMSFIGTTKSGYVLAETAKCFRPRICIAVIAVKQLYVHGYFQLQGPPW